MLRFVLLKPLMCLNEPDGRQFNNEVFYSPSFF